MNCILSSGSRTEDNYCHYWMSSCCGQILRRGREISDDLKSTTVTINDVRPRQSVATLQDLSLYSHRLALRGIQWSYCDVRREVTMGLRAGSIRGRLLDYNCHITWESLPTWNAPTNLTHILDSWDVSRRLWQEQRHFRLWNSCNSCLSQCFLAKN